MSYYPGSAVTSQMQQMSLGGQQHQGSRLTWGANPPAGTTHARGSYNRTSEQVSGRNAQASWNASMRRGRPNGSEMGALSAQMRGMSFGRGGSRTRTRSQKRSSRVKTRSKRRV